jgi:hypothetical protein
MLFTVSLYPSYPFHQSTQEQQRQQVPDMLCFVERRPENGKPGMYIDMIVDSVRNVAVRLSIPADQRSCTVLSYNVIL